MELFPIYDENSKISKNIWYSISGIGESPFMRVGHTIVHSKKENSKGNFYIIGGANPSGSFNDVYVLNMDTLSWDKFEEDLENFEKGRYEHACLFDENNKQIYIFGGSNEEGSLDSFLKFDIDQKKCSKILNQSSNSPTGRTIHVGVSFKNQLVVFGGGSEGKSSVEDQKVYIYNPVNNKWISLNLQGNLPTSRQGHLMLNYNDSQIYLHGGMKDEVIYDDLWMLDMKKMSWTCLEYKKEQNFPCARAAHGGICVNNSLYVFGGIDQTGMALDDLWKYDLEQNQWTLIEIFGYKPPARLDFAYCKASFRPNKILEDNVNKSEESNVENKQELYEKEEDFLVIHGGMDTEGNVFDDIFMINLE